ncbi:hypothetical protein [Pararhizobium haloflavum]|uniref:hypothetical protein n=1 Tax=Pararhizobium haloflavum TaxID=2037914 RepID=UPI0012FFF367|nr:hypothetical protein [Pararhizobium haloflavum]
MSDRPWWLSADLNSPAYRMWLIKTVLGDGFHVALAPHPGGVKVCAMRELRRPKRSA